MRNQEEQELAGEDHRHFYRNHARDYDALVARKNTILLETTIRSLILAENPRLLECGAGTGRMTRVFANFARSVVALDRESAMLEVARENSHHWKHRDNITFLLADTNSIPLETHSVDAGIACWVFEHFPFWYPEDWKGRLEASIREMGRCIQPPGRIFLCETMGTAVSSPRIPEQELIACYDFYKELGFTFLGSFDTSYTFPSNVEAVVQVESFFGQETAERVRRSNAKIVPEFTGIWVRP